MKIFNNKFFIIGLVSLLLVSIPLTIYTLSKKQTVTSKAAASSTLAFSPSSVTSSVSNNFNVDINLDPKDNIVSVVKLSISFDQNKIEGVDITPNSSSFPLTIEAPTITAGKITLSLGIGSDPANAVRTQTKVATINFKAIGSTGGVPTNLVFDQNQTQVLSLATSTQTEENVLSSVSPASVTIDDGTQASYLATPTPTAVITNTLIPACDADGLIVTPSSGSAPLSVSLKAKGSSQGGAFIKRAIFDFGDGQSKETSYSAKITSTTAQTRHIYKALGDYTASITFVDSSSSASIPCSTTIKVASGSSTLAAPGSMVTPLGIGGGILLMIFGVLLLTAL